MKTNKFILAGLMAVGMLLSACTEEPPVYQPAAPEANEVQAYIYSDTKTSYQFVALEQSFPVVIGRNQTEGEATFELLTNDTIGAFEVEPVHFAAGEKSTTVNVTVKLSYGESYGLTLSVPENYTTAYGQPTVSIAIVVDFTWMPMGAVQFESGFCGGTAKLKIEQAKEYVDADGNLLFRLNSPYYYATGAQWCTAPGLHLQFLLDKNYNAVDMFEYGFIQMLDNGPYFSDGVAPINYAYYDPINYGNYCFFVNDGDIYQLGILFSDMSGLTMGGEVWQWVEGYPGAVAE